jgi:hypothetical protein
MTGDRKILVGSASATNNRAWENAAHHMQAIARDHSGLVKFTRQDEIQEVVLLCLENFMESASDVIDSRFSALETGT